MKRILRRFTALLGITLALGLFVAAAPAYAADSVVEIDSATDTLGVKAAVEAALVTSDSVTVKTGGGEPYDAGSSDLKLFIPAGKTVVWEADYTGAVPAEEALLFLAGGGTFVVSDCSITNTGEGSVVYQGNGNVVITGDSTISGNSLALACSGDIDIQSGTITSGKGVGAINCMGKLTMSAGVVYAGEGYAIFGEGINSAITISGGLIFATFADTETASSAHGTEEDFLSSAITMIRGKTPVIEGSAVVVVWNSLSGNTNYSAGMADDLNVTPAGSAAWWSQDGLSGVRYNATEFFPINTVTVTDTMAIPSANENASPGAGNTVLIVVLVAFVVLAVALLLVWRWRRNLKRAAGAAGDSGDSAAAKAEGDGAAAEAESDGAANTEVLADAPGKDENS